MWSFLVPFFTETPEAPLILPDSVQKANLAEAVNKIIHLDVGDMLRSLLSESVWILVKILIALAIYFIGRWIVRRIVRLLDAAFERRQVDTSLRSFLRNTVKVVFTLILLMIVVQTLGVNVTSLIALFSAATLAIGMALSGTAQNFAGGVMILLMKPYRVGDFISAQGQSGTVREIKLYSTVITTGDNQTIYIPNNSIATAIIDNYSTSETRRVDWTIGISYGDDVDAARRALLDLLAADSRVLTDPAPVVWVAALADSSVNLSVRVWVKKRRLLGRVFREQRKNLQTAAAQGHQLPFPADGRTCETKLSEEYMKKLLFAAAAVWLLAACNKELGPEYETPPVFDEVTFTTATQPDKITEPVKVDEVVWVNATVSCPYKVKQVWLAYFVDGDESNVVTTKPFNYDATTVTFKERIPGQKAGAKVSFQVLTRSDYVFMWTQTYTYKVEGGEDEEKPNPDLPDEN